MFLKRKRDQNECGQALVLFALVLVMLTGFSAFGIDIGRVALEKSRLQNAADASALAGALELPSCSTAISTAVSCADSNGVGTSNVSVTTPYDSNSDLIEVVCSETLEYTFARVLGFTSTEVSARAVAERGWEARALPFINMDDNYYTDADGDGKFDIGEGDQIKLWDKLGMGAFERILNFEIVDIDDPTDKDAAYFKLTDYLQGVEFESGVDSSIGAELDYCFTQSAGSTVFIVSLRSDVLASGKVLLTDGTTVPITDEEFGKLGNKEWVDPSQLVLLECRWDELYLAGENSYLTLTVVEDYDYQSNEIPFENDISKLVD